MLSKPVREQSKGSEGIQLSHSSVYLLLNLLTFLYVQCPEVTEVQHVPISLLLLFHTGLKFLCCTSLAR